VAVTTTVVGASVVFFARLVRQEPKEPRTSGPEPRTSNPEPRTREPRNPGTSEPRNLQ
jgi:hypothetical protein